MRRITAPLTVLAAILMGACGSSPSAPSSAATITIGPNGVSPKDVRIRAWNFVTFVNNDTRTHTIASDPVDLHTQCPPINRVGILLPGESRDTSTLTVGGTCGYHDHGNPSDSAFQGRIIVE
jgi:plastocyanin